MRVLFSQSEVRGKTNIRTLWALRTPRIRLVSDISLGIEIVRQTQPRGVRNGYDIGPTGSLI